MATLDEFEEEVESDPEADAEIAALQVRLEASKKARAEREAAAADWYSKEAAGIGDGDSGGDEQEETVESTAFLSSGGRSPSRQGAEGSNGGQNALFAESSATGTASVQDQLSKARSMAESRVETVRKETLRVSPGDSPGPEPTDSPSAQGAASLDEARAARERRLLQSREAHLREVLESAANGDPQLLKDFKRASADYRHGRCPVDEYVSRVEAITGDWAERVLPLAAAAIPDAERQRELSQALRTRQRDKAVQMARQMRIQKQGEKRAKKADATVTGTRETQHQERPRASASGSQPVAATTAAVTDSTAATADATAATRSSVPRRSGAVQSLLGSPTEAAKPPAASRFQDTAGDTGNRGETPAAPPAASDSRRSSRPATSDPLLAPRPTPSLAGETGATQGVRARAPSREAVQAVVRSTAASGLAATRERSRSQQQEEEGRGTRPAGNSGPTEPSSNEPPVVATAPYLRGQLSLMMYGSQEVPDSGGTSFAEYVVQCTWKCQRPRATTAPRAATGSGGGDEEVGGDDVSVTWLVARRYREFEELHDIVLENLSRLPESREMSVPRLNMPSLPGKSFFRSGTHPDVQNERRIGLSKFLVALLRHFPSALQLGQVDDFFRLTPRLASTLETLHNQRYGQRMINESGPAAVRGGAGRGSGSGGGGVDSSSATPPAVAVSSPSSSSFPFSASPAAAATTAEAHVGPMSRSEVRALEQAVEALSSRLRSVNVTRSDPRRDRHLRELVRHVERDMSRIECTLEELTRPDRGEQGGDEEEEEEKAIAAGGQRDAAENDATLAARLLQVEEEASGAVAEFHSVMAVARAVFH